MREFIPDKQPIQLWAAPSPPSPLPIEEPGGGVASFRQLWARSKSTEYKFTPEGLFSPFLGMSSHFWLEPTRTSWPTSAPHCQPISQLQCACIPEHLLVAMKLDWRLLSAKTWALLLASVTFFHPEPQSFPRDHSAAPRLCPENHSITELKGLEGTPGDLPAWPCSGLHRVPGSAGAPLCHWAAPQRVPYVRGIFPAYLKSFTFYMHVLHCVSLPKMPLNGFATATRAEKAQPCFLCSIYSCAENNEERIVKVEWKKNTGIAYLSEWTGVTKAIGGVWSDELCVMSHLHLPGIAKHKVFARQRARFNHLSLHIFICISASLSLPFGFSRDIFRVSCKPAWIRVLDTGSEQQQGLLLWQYTSARKGTKPYHVSPGWSGPCTEGPSFSAFVFIMGYTTYSPDPFFSEHRICSCSATVHQKSLLQMEFQLQMSKVFLFPSNAPLH